LCNRRINQFGHDFTLSPTMATKYGMYSVFSKCDSKRMSSVEGFLFDVFVSPATRATKTPHPNRQLVSQVFAASCVIWIIASAECEDRMGASFH
jgi:hypothetical protein